MVTVSVHDKVRSPRARCERPIVAAQNAKAKSRASLYREYCKRILKAATKRLLWQTMDLSTLRVLAKCGDLCLYAPEMCHASSTREHPAHLPRNAPNSHLLTRQNGHQL